MYLLQRNMFRRMAVNTALTFLLLGGVGTTTQVFNQLYRLIEASSNMVFALQLYAFLIPTVTTTILPFAYLIGVMTVLRTMEEDREAVILAGSGASAVFLAKPAALLGAIVAVIVLVVSVWIEPVANREARTATVLLSGDIARYVASQGSLTEIEDGLFVRGGRRAADGDIQGLFILDKRDPRQEVIYVAEEGRVIEAPDGDGLVLEMFGGSIHVREVETNGVHRFSFGRYLSTVPWFEEAAALTYGTRETPTASLWPGSARDSQFRVSDRDALSELVRRLTDWLYTGAYLGIGFAVWLLSRGTRFAYRWFIPSTIVAACVVRAAGLALLGQVGQGPHVIWMLFGLPVAAMMAPLAAAASIALRSRLRHA